MPEPAGLIDTVSAYCVLKLAVNVPPAAGAEMVCVCAPPSLQLANTFRVPDAVCGDVAPIVCALDAVQEKVLGVVYDVPSTTTASPGGFVVTIVAVALRKLAVTVRGVAMVTLAVVVAPLASPLQLSKL